MVKVKIDPSRVITHEPVAYNHKRNLEPWCPTCGASECHPYSTEKILIRGAKHFDSSGAWSQCLVCSGYYDLNLNEQPDKHDPEKGWFVE